MTQQAATTTTSDATRMKLVVIGDKSAGKTVLLLTFLNGSYPTDFVPNLNVMENFFHHYNYKGTNIKMHCWDTSGQEDMEKLRRLSYLNTHVFIVMYSIIDRDSFKNVQDKWAKDVNEFAAHVPFVLVATDVEQREVDVEKKFVTYEEGYKMAENMGAVCFVEVSPRLQHNVKELFELCCAIKMLDSEAIKKNQEASRNERDKKRVLKEILASQKAHATANSAPTPKPQAPQEEKKKNRLSIENITKLFTKGLGNGTTTTVPQIKTTDASNDQQQHQQVVITKERRGSFNEQQHLLPGLLTDNASLDCSFIHQDTAHAYQYILGIALGEKKRRVNVVKVLNLLDFKEIVYKTFLIDHEARKQYTLEYYDETLHDFYELDNMENLPHICKIRILKAHHD